MNRWKCRTLAAALLAATTFGIAPSSSAQAADRKSEANAWAGRHYDLRTTLPAPESLAANPAQDAALARWRSAVPDLAVDRDARTGATRTIQNRTGFLTGTRSGGDAESLAVDFVASELALLGLAAGDLADYELTNVVPSRHNGLSHVYLRQRHGGLPVYNAQLQVNVKSDGRVLSVHNQFLPNLAAAVRHTEPGITARQAVDSVADLLGERATNLVDRADQARLMYLPIQAGEARLVWNFQVETADRESWYDVTVDAVDGRVWTMIDWTASDSYTVYELPVESPNHTTPVPPADGRTDQLNPAAANGSPFGWHDTNGAAGAEFTTTQGNNVHAYTDTDANNTPDAGSSPDGGASLVFDFPLDLTLAPSAYRPAAVTNLFYWNNIQHDVLYQYGFDEAGGNFQENNYGFGGLGSDYVNAEAQDGSGTNNANFSTPADGLNPRMQMYIWTAPTPDKDGDLDNGIILHEYGHGVSNRLTGGPANVGCLGNSEQGGEGWSDWMSVWFTARAGDTPTQNRGVGTYALNQPTNGPGIRPAPYTTDMTVNTYTYANLGSMAVPHGVGFVWNTMLWEMYWGLVDAHGFNPDLYDDWTTGGNNLAQQLVIDGMKLQPCSPGFVDARNAILAADTALTGGANQCIIWEAFAKRGLGFSASQGTSTSTSDGTAATDIPPTCSFGNAGGDVRVCSATATDHVQNILVGPAYTTPPVDMSVVGNPAGTTLLWSEDPVSGPLPETPTLTIGNLGAAAAGSYNIDVTGLDGGANTATDTFVLTVDAAAPAAPALVSPIHGTSGYPVRPQFQWGALATATEYDLEVDDNADFSSPVYTATAIAGTSHTATSDLPTAVPLYWRVRGVNTCGDGAQSLANRFVANANGASSPTCFDVNVPIPDGNTSGVENVQAVATTGVISDLDVSITMQPDHTWLGDMIVRLTKGATTVTLIDRPGIPGSTFGCSANLNEVTLSDEAGSAIENPPSCNTDAAVISGTFSPSGSLSAFDGQSLDGSWTLFASDSVTPDTGTIDQWCLNVTSPDSMPFLDGFETNDLTRWSSSQP